MLVQRRYEVHIMKFNYSPMSVLLCLSRFLFKQFSLAWATCLQPVRRPFDGDDGFANRPILLIVNLYYYRVPPGSVTISTRACPCDCVWQTLSASTAFNWANAWNGVKMKETKWCRRDALCGLQWSPCDFHTLEVSPQAAHCSPAHTRPDAFIFN